MPDDHSGSTDGLDFEPAPDAAPAPRARKRGRRGGLRRKLTSTLVMLGALGAMGTAYATFATSSGADAEGQTAEKIATGQGIYSNSCITCHGPNLEGVRGQGPSLVGVGSAATYFQVITGRMPVAAQGAYIQGRPPKFDEEETEALAAYVQSVGGGPETPEGDLRSQSSQIAQGGEIFRQNCASCHGNTGAGAPLSGGKSAPNLHDATDKEIYTAMLSGPANMPIFGDSTITPADKKAVISYIQTLKASADPGGDGIARIGPVSEAVVIWVGGVGALMIAILWIGARTR